MTTDEAIRYFRMKTDQAEHNGRPEVKGIRVAVARAVLSCVADSDRIAAVIEAWQVERGLVKRRKRRVA